MSQKEIIGKGTIAKLKEILSERKLNNIFLVTGKSSYEKSGAKDAIEPILSDYKVTHFSDFEVNPKVKDIEKGMEIFKKNNCDFVIAIGGGSVMDIAKSINILASNEGNPTEYIKNQKNIENKGKVLVAVPTTSGSGSEATRSAVVYIDKTKYSLAHEFIIPDYTIVDSQLTMNLPKHITASAGMDALSQAIESYWCIDSTEESKDYAREAIKLIMGNLTDAVNNPTRESREAMAEASFLAGKAINISRTTACHAIAYPITSYFGVPHGHAVALTLAQMLVYNSKVTEKDILDKRGINYVHETLKEIAGLIGADDIQDANKRITSLMEEIGLKTRLSEIGVKTDEDIEIIIKNGFNPQRVNNNPRLLTEETLRNEILDEIK
tara:strand:+ start:182 stop:1324 length:1143 start_codon:yes stop_codon:yes gene_type:complete